MSLKTLIKKNLILLCFIFGVFYSYGQNKDELMVSEDKLYKIDSAKIVGYAWFFNAQGNIYDFDNKPLEGVVVTYRSKRGVFKDTTDIKGKFYIDSILGKRGLLRFEKEGYKPLSQYVSSTINLYITLTIDPEGVFEEQEIGYGTSNKYKRTGATTHISGKMVRSGVIQDIVQCLAGKGGLSPDLKIRGCSFLPLFVINGIPKYTPPYLTKADELREYLLEINPEDVEYVEVLKDAASTAIYGNRGGNGVVLIRTKNSKIVKKPKMTTTKNTK